jgi:hypothetical protein
MNIGDLIKREITVYESGDIVVNLEDFIKLLVEESKGLINTTVRITVEEDYDYHTCVIVLEGYSPATQEDVDEYINTMRYKEEHTKKQYMQQLDTLLNKYPNIIDEYKTLAERKERFARKRKERRIA